MKLLLAFCAFGIIVLTGLFAGLACFTISTDFDSACRFKLCGVQLAFWLAAPIATYLAFAKYKQVAHRKLIGLTMCLLLTPPLLVHLLGVAFVNKYGGVGSGGPVG